jgi:hypothetical protein
VASCMYVPVRMGHAHGWMWMHAWVDVDACMGGCGRGCMRGWMWMWMWMWMNAHVGNGCVDG